MQRFSATICSKRLNTGTSGVLINNRMVYFVGKRICIFTLFALIYINPLIVSVCGVSEIDLQIVEGLLHGCHV